MRHRRALLIGLAALAAMGATACGRGIGDSAQRAAIESALQHQSSTDRDLATSVSEWYAARDYRLAWNDDDRVKAAEKVLQAAASHGLNPEWYGPSRIEAARAARRQSKARGAERAKPLATFDIDVTTALMHVGRDVAIGRMRPALLDERWKSARTSPDLVSTLNAAVDGGTLDDWFDQVAPRHPEYGQLRAWLAELRKRPGFDASDPHVGQIAANLERLRWLPDDLGERHIIVNIPEFMLRAREHHRTVLEMRVVVGKPDGHETPVLSGALESVVFNPYWNLPDSIVMAETLPAIAKDPDYLERHDMEVLRASAKGTTRVDPDDVDWKDPQTLKALRIRQRPGDDNALGDIKFPFRNEQAIYLHDTPSTALFARESRAFSHGCVRVAEPEVLARYVLSDRAEWTADRIAETVKGDTESHVPVTAELPLHLVYLTVVTGPDGQPKYLADIYGFDRRQLSIRE